MKISTDIKDVAQDLVRDCPQGAVYLGTRIVLEHSRQFIVHSAYDVEEVFEKLWLRKIRRPGYCCYDRTKH